MTDDLTPPPDEALPDQARARIRAELLAAAQAEPGRRPWAVPLVAAASVLVVVGLGAWVVRAGRDDDGPPVVAPSSDATLHGPDWTMGWPDDPIPSEPSGKATLDLSTCVDPIGRVLSGAHRVATFPSGAAGGETTVWATGERFALCDERAGTTTVLAPGTLPPEEHASTYDVTSIALPTAQGSELVLVAGGAVPDGALAFDVEYTFPDGHVERATRATGDDGRTWWRMVHAAPGDGVGGPIEVTVSYSGARHTYEVSPRSAAS
ncbi:hypothetical protein ASC77_02930 [Nocardioides sp. Root1257]|uniref:hypothetical protein n=1 Tax=unclassified Nocardioides TaxID=2615069 RepID=UPI0006F6A742|nr:MULTISPECIES: hypothetical protein [unclassified Nocardioides]KQW53261.1 hypothetical protein ASC77_02930 [Nocardioides sp. Root1257]KRC55947.1 hypothetical protein ASE24_02930 [Nocardioides sp. Root224]